MAALPTTLRALASTGGLRRVLSAYFLFSIVENAIWIAILFYAYAEGGVQLAGVVAVVQLVPAAVLAPPLATFADRLPRSTALLLSHGAVVVATALTTVALLAGAAVPVVVACSALATVAISVVRPVHFAALPQMSSTPQELVSANALSSSADGLSLFVGPVLAGLGAAFAGPWLVFVGATVTALVATLLCARLRLAAPPRPDSGDGWRDAFRGLAVLWRDRAATALLLVLSLRYLLAGAIEVLAAPYAHDALGLGDSAAGLILGALGIGLIIGSAVAGWAASQGRLAPVIAAGGVIQGLAVAVLGAIVLLAPAAVSLAIVGVASAVVIVAGRTLLQRTTDDRVLARVFAVEEGLALVGLALGAALAPVFSDWLGPAGAFVPFGALAAIATLAVYLPMRRLDARSVVPREQLALLERIPFIAALAPFERERLARESLWVEAQAGEAIVRQGEPGDRYYVIASGTFAVEVDGIDTGRVLGEGEGFGEIALLHVIPRTATITARTDGRLLAVEGPDFLAAVTGSADGHALAQELAETLRRGGSR